MDEHRLHEAFACTLEGELVALVDAADDAVARLQQARAASAVGEEAYDEAFLMRYACDTAVLGGVRLSTATVQQAMAGTLGAEASDEALIAKGIVETQRFTLEALAAGRPLDVAILKEFHTHIALEYPSATRGAFRVTRSLTRNFFTTTAMPGDIPDDVAELAAQAAQASCHALVRAAVVHAELMSIDPFVGATGRTARAVLNYMLMAEGYPPVSVPASQRVPYLQHLQAFEAVGSVEGLLALLAKGVADEAHGRIEALQAGE